MPASEETYRSQPNLHLVFALTSVAMLLSFVWMIAADHLRPWKETQREFHYIEDAKLRVEEKKRADELNQKELAAIDAKLKAASDLADENAKQIRAQEKELGFSFDYIVVCTVTGSTHAGMLVGFAKDGRERRVIGIDASATPAQTKAQVLDIARQAQPLLLAGQLARGLADRVVENEVLDGLKEWQDHFESVHHSSPSATCTK